MPRPFLTMILATCLACAGSIQRPTPDVACPADAWRWALGSDATRDLRVWIDTRAQTLDGWGPYGWRRLRVAMDEWNSIRLPVRMVEAESARDSDIVVDVIDTIPGTESRDQAGATTVTHLNGTISRARVFVAIASPSRSRFTVADQVSNLMHELGHALGLGHVTDAKALMSARRYAPELTAADITLARRHFSCARG